jgi:phospholipase C
MVPVRYVRALFTLVLACSAGCGGNGVPAAPQQPGGQGYIKHVVIIVQENRSFDDLFSGFPGADAPSFGYAGKKRVPLHPTRLENPGNIENNWRDAIGGWDRGKMDGFEREHFYGGPLNFAYAYVPRD